MQISDIKENQSKGEYKIAQGYNYRGDDYWDWWIWIEASEDNLNKIESVTYNLHRTFIKPVRIINSRQDKFKLKTSGWGTFIIYAILKFKDDSIELSHKLELRYPDGKKTEE